ncbi:hypothetical protein JHK82_027061 [Glycine max]|uniref:Uncharacterized protein n=2 Tax=Glycine subgen. Soja TaxID=1462606 RepID=A0A0R0HYG2_SOYBN|nr:hypothetical protein JHK87_026956 [Glycine soja]KAG4996258.1 hypothetical protein JHK85_027697 [Glycine max]KAG5003050.1 hypothetical protein JHK86_027189 [Glycine max]KAG5126226.1 hypothetical protein JHK82_027061 [Glycine max]KAH1137025.1 hypothetical protein GYH30_027134 [Glycine max]
MAHSSLLRYSLLSLGLFSERICSSAARLGPREGDVVINKGREVAWTVAALSKKPRGVRGEELAALGFNCSIIRTRFSERKCTHTG